MAFKDREQATDFELATVDLFQNVFGFTARHVGPKGLTPDVLLLSDDEGYSAILDNKAYSKYSITNDHHNRMVYNYIGQLNNYYNGTYPLSFFSYIAGGFGSNINIQLNRVVNETGINGSAINISTMINLVYEHTSNPYTQQRIRDIFSLNRRVLQADL
nr:restriction endonuclease FokI C-terminal domain-containing protein [Gilliamella sp. Pas-s25]